MAQYTFQLRGWQAMAAIVLLAGITGVQIYLRVRPVDDAMRDAVRAELLKEYSGRGPKDVTRYLAASARFKPMISGKEPVGSGSTFGISGGNVALAADAVQSAMCAYLALIALVGLAMNALLRITWFDPLAALVAVELLLKEGRDAFQGRSCGWS